MIIMLTINKNSDTFIIAQLMELNNNINKKNAIRNGLENNNIFDDLINEYFKYVQETNIVYHEVYII